MAVTKSRMFKKKSNIAPDAPVVTVRSIPVLPPIVSHCYTAPYNCIPYTVRFTPDIGAFLQGREPPLPAIGDLREKYTWPRDPNAVYFTDIPPLNLRQEDQQQQSTMIKEPIQTTQECSINVKDGQKKVHYQKNARSEKLKTGGKEVPNNDAKSKKHATTSSKRRKHTRGGGGGSGRSKGSRNRTATEGLKTSPPAIVITEAQGGRENGEEVSGKDEFTSGYQIIPREDDTAILSSRIPMKSLQKR